MGYQGSYPAYPGAPPSPAPSSPGARFERAHSASVVLPPPPIPGMGQGGVAMPGMGSAMGSEGPMNTLPPPSVPADAYGAPPSHAIPDLPAFTAVPRAFVPPPPPVLAGSSLGMGGLGSGARRPSGGTLQIVGRPGLPPPPPVLASSAAAAQMPPPPMLAGSDGTSFKMERKMTSELI